MLPPDAVLIMVPPSGSSDELAIPANFKATEFAKPIWPSILDNQTYTLGHFERK